MKDENGKNAVLRSAQGTPMVLEGVAASGLLRGLMFELRVEQRYRNPTAANVEVVYTFPLPYHGVLLDLEVEIGGRRLAAAVVEKREAEGRYEDALDQGDSALLLERAADGLCTLSLGNLMAGETAVIRYRYGQLLRFEHGSVRLAIPTVIAPRYGDAESAGLAPHQVPQTSLAATYPLTLALDLEGVVTEGRLSSPSHRIEVVRTERGVRVTPAAAFLDRDFVLDVDGLAGRTLVSLARDGEACVALASFVADVPQRERQLPLALKLVVDCSGSMAGDSIAAARRALHRVLMGLEPSDRFALTRFGSQVRHETRGLVAADAAAIRAGAEALGRMDADLGGTEMEPALTAAFALGPGDVLLITDGEVWNAGGLFQAAGNSRQRVFVVGIGSAPAEGVLQRLAQASGGACEFVAPNEDVEGAILRMFARLRAPCVERADVAWPATSLWQAPLPAGLFGGETIHAFAGFAARPEGEAVLTLVPTGDGAPLRSRARFEGALAEDETLARMAAAIRLPALEETLQLAFALRYRLLTERTNLVVVAERAAGEKATQLPQLAVVPQMHAAGWHGLGTVNARFDIQFCATLPAESRARLDEPAHDAPGLDALVADGLDAAWRPLLAVLQHEGFAEDDVGTALLAVLAQAALAAPGRLPRHAARQLRRWATVRIEPALRARVQAIVAAVPALRDAALAWVRRQAAAQAVTA